MADLTHLAATVVCHACQARYAIPLHAGPVIGQTVTLTVAETDKVALSIWAGRHVGPVTTLP